MSEPPILFEVMTPLGFRVHCYQSCWQDKILVGHPVMEGRVEDVKRALTTPDEIRLNQTDERENCMEKVKVLFDPNDNSLIVWFDDPQTMAYLSPIEEDTPGEFHLIRNEAGQVIGAEFQFYHLRPGSVSIEAETAPLFIEQLPATHNK